MFYLEPKYKNKYLKYKNKYLNFKNQIGGNEWNLLCEMPIIFYDISPDNKYLATIHEHDINIWDIHTYTLYAEFHIENITFYNKEIETDYKFQTNTKRDSYKDFDSSAFAWCPNSQYFAVSGNNYELTIREDETLSKKQTTDEIIIIDCIEKQVIKRYKSDEVVKESNVINTLSWNNTSTELLSISFIEQKVVKWNITNDEKQIIFNDSKFSNKTRIVTNDDFSLLMHIKKNGQSYTLLIIKNLNYKDLYKINLNSHEINDCYFSKSNKNNIFVITEYDSLKTINKLDISPFINNNEQKSKLIYEYKFNIQQRNLIGELGIKNYYNCSPNLNYIYICNNGNIYILNTENNKLIPINYSDILNEEVIWSENSKYFYYLIHNKIIFINLDDEITVSEINVDCKDINIKLSNDNKLFFFTLPNNIRIIDTVCLIKEKIVFIEDDNTEFLNTEIINTMIDKLQNPLYQLRTNTLYNYINHKTNLDFTAIKNIFNNKEKRLWLFTDKKHISDTFVFPTINSDSDNEEPIINDSYLSKFQKNMLINDIKKKNIIHENMNWGDSQTYIQSNYFCIFYGYLSDFPDFNKKVNIRGNHKKYQSSYFIFDAEILLKKTIDNIFNSYKEYDSKLEHKEEWSTQNMIYFNKRWPFGRIGKKEQFGHPIEEIDYSVRPYKTSIKYMHEDTTLCDTIKFSDDENIKNLKITNFINKLICKIKDIPPEKIDKNELCIRFPINVNLTTGLFKISTSSLSKPYQVFTYKNFLYNN